MFTASQPSRQCHAVSATVVTVAAFSSPTETPTISIYFGGSSSKSANWLSTTAGTVTEFCRETLSRNPLKNLFTWSKRSPIIELFCSGILSFISNPKKIQF